MRNLFSVKNIYVKTLIMNTIAASLKTFWNQTGLISSFAVLLNVTVYGQINGLWHTSFKVLGTSLRMDMKIENAFNQPSIKLKDPDVKNSAFVAMDDVQIIDSSISFSMISRDLSFIGKYHAN